MEYVSYSIDVSEELKRDIDQIIVEDGFNGYDDFFTKLVQNELEKRREQCNRTASFTSPQLKTAQIVFSSADAMLCLDFWNGHDKLLLS